MTDSTPATAATEIPVVRYRRALEAIVACPNPDSVENCHDQMWGIAKEALGV